MSTTRPTLTTHRNTGEPAGYDKSTSRSNPSGGAPTLYLYFPNVTVSMRPASSWLTYLNTTVGRTCNLGFSASTSKITESFTDSVTLLGKRVVASGTELVYRIVDVSVFTGQPMTRSAMRAVYLVPNSGELDVIPQTISSGGVDYQFAAFEVYPPPGQLSVPSETMQSSMVVKLGGSTASARKQLGPLNGAELLMGVNVKPAPAVARIRTDVGVFRNTVGIVLTPTTLSWLTKVPVSAESETSQLLSGFQNLLTTTEYYAVGVGPVESGVVGAAFSLVFEGVREQIRGSERAQRARYRRCPVTRVDCVDGVLCASAEFCVGIGQVLPNGRRDGSRRLRLETEAPHGSQGQLRECQLSYWLGRS